MEYGEPEPFDGPYDWRAAIEQNPEQGFDGLPDKAMAAAVEILAEEMDNELAGEESGMA